MEIVQEVLKPEGGRILFVIADGLGGVPHPQFGGMTELEAARRPNLDRLARKSVLGLAIPVVPGVSPGSGPAHLALFGYDPLVHRIGRGVLEALGIGFPLTPRDVAIRANFATVDPQGVIVDRRAGRIPTEESRKLVERLQQAIPRIGDVEVILQPGKEHRFVVIFRGEELSDAVEDTDPGKEGLPPNPPTPRTPEAQKTAEVAEAFLKQAFELLRDQEKANAVLLRGFAKTPDIEPFPKRYRLRALALATYPMYKGLARLLGMDTPDVGDRFEDAISHLKAHGKDYDFIYIHYKDTDKAGEDGDFLRKVQAIEYLDSKIPELLEIEPQVVVVTGDHCTPALLRAHSWHPSPVLLHSPWPGADDAEVFTERACRTGALGVFLMKDLMPLALANAGRTVKFGA